MANSKAFKNVVRAWMAVNPGWSFQAAANHLRELRASKDAATRERQLKLGGET